MTDKVERLLLSETEASEVLKLSPRTLFGMRQRGEIRFLKRGKTVRYSIEELKRWVDANQQEQSTDGF